MPPSVIDLRSADDTRDVVHRAVQALAEGKVVAFPTETVYGIAASALNEAAVQRLLEAKGRREGNPLALAVKSGDDALDYVPGMSPLAQRLARRCWPGPVTLVVADEDRCSLLRRLPPPVQQAVVPNATVGFRVPAHRMILDVLQMIAGPLALTSANRTGEPEATTAQEVVEALGDDVSLIVDDGPSRYGQASSVVQVDGNTLKVLRAGVVAESTIRRLASLVVLFVCTGNTCRSPMAEVLCRRLIADRLGCKPEELEERGVIVLSAGIAAMPGGLPSPEAVEVLREMGLHLDEHESQPLTPQLVRQADLILTMTQAHREAILKQWPDAAERVDLLRADRGDISDPIGGPAEVYRECAKQIQSELELRVEKLELG